MTVEEQPQPLRTLVRLGRCCLLLGFLLPSSAIAQALQEGEIGLGWLAAQVLLGALVMGVGAGLIRKTPMALFWAACVSGLLLLTSTGYAHFNTNPFRWTQRELVSIP